MRNILFYISIFLFLFVPFHHANAAWYNSSWLYRIPLVIDNTKVDADLTDFPVYVNLNDLSSDFHTNVKSDGCDIRMTTSDGSTEVPIDLVFYTAASDIGELHFKAPSLANSSDTTFYIYYGNSGALCIAEDATYGAQNTWNSAYKAVYHLQEAVNNTPAGYKDSTSNNNDATGTSMAITAPDGKLGGRAQDFDGSLDYIIGTASIASTNTFTIEAWVNPDGKSQYDGIVVTDGFGGLGGLILNVNATNMNMSYNEAQYDDASGLLPSNSVWSYVAGRISASEVKTYMNTSSFVNDTAAQSSLSATNWYIGRDRAIAGRFWDGKIDEIRLSATNRSDAWISTSYNNQNSSSTFYTDSAQETGRTFTLKRPPNNFLGLVARYTFDGGDMVSNVADSSGNGYHGYLQNQTPTTTTIGKLGQALRFDGSNDVVDIPSFTDLSRPITFSFWLKGNAQTDKTILQASTYSNNFIIYTRFGNQIALFRSLADEYGFNFTLDGEWHHIVFVIDSSGGRAVYKDGVSQTVVNISGTASAPQTSTALKIGNGLGAYAGSLDDIRIYNRALSSSEIKQIYDSSESKMNFASSHVVRDGLIGYWSMNGSDMLTRVEDRSGFGNHGYLVGQTSTTTIIGKLGQALSFDGVNDYIQIFDNDSFSVTSSGFSVAYWMKIDTIPPASSANRMFILGKGTASNYEWDMAINSFNSNYGKILFHLYNAAGSNSLFRPSLTSPQVGRWYHVVATVAGPSSAPDIYIDGVLDNGTSSGSVTASNTGSNVHLGARTDLAENELDGVLDEVRIYNRVLTPAEVKQLYLTGQVKLVP